MNSICFTRNAEQQNFFSFIHPYIAKFITVFVIYLKELAAAALESRELLLLLLIHHCMYRYINYKSPTRLYYYNIILL